MMQAMITVRLRLDTHGDPTNENGVGIRLQLKALRVTAILILPSVGLLSPQ